MPNASEKIKLSFPLSKAIFPTLPLKMLSTTLVYEFFTNSENYEIAKKLLKKSPDASLNDLLDILKKLNVEEKICCPYLWGLQPFAPSKRAIYEDVLGNRFIKLDNKWRQVFQTDYFGDLLGIYLTEGIVPKNAYFWIYQEFGYAKPHIV
ncbi:MAG: hypothetical protein PSV17_08200 [Methylotenera sp.]|uniref:hypothetical protein n=1 Tax=Methylotenera sp. TaxID=2051956 RepID=UPI00248721D7|nr:hypothetical protein [Methylotenera sp.]MDI1309402.1 hypothetical protein [Methylotenera sp.]